MAGPIASEYLIIRADSSQVMSELRKLEGAATASGNKVEAALATKFKRAGANMTRVGRTMTRNVTLPIVAIGAAAGKMALDFESSMTNIRALVGASDEQMASYRDTIMELAPAVGKGPKELADALYFITSSGFEGAEALDVLEVSAKASAAGLGETQVVADAVTSAVNSYGVANLSAASAADILTAAVREGKGEPEELAGAIGRVIPVAQEMGVEFHEVGGALASLTLGGLDASEATTALRGVLSSLLKPTEQAKEVMDRLGYSSDELRSMLEQDFIGTLMELRTATEGDTEAMGALFGNVRGLVGQLSLTGANADKVTGIMGRLADATGTVNTAFGEVKGTPAQELKDAWAELQVALIEMGNVVLPLVTDIAGAVAEIGTAFAALPDPIRNSILVMLGLAAVTGPILRVAGAVANMTGAVIAFRAANLATATSQIVPGLTNLGATAGLAGIKVAELGAAAARAAPHVAIFLGGLRLLENVQAEGVLDGISKTVYGLTEAEAEATGQTMSFSDAFEESLSQAAMGAEVHLSAAADAMGNLSVSSAIAGSAVKTASGEIVEALGAITGAHEESAASAREHKRAELALVGGFTGIKASLLDAADASRELRVARENLRKAEADAGKGSIEYKEAQRALTRAQLDAIDSQVSAKEAVKEYANELKDSKATNEEVETRVRKFGTAAGLTKGEIDKLIGSVDRYTPKVKGVPDSKATNFSAPGLAAVSQGVQNLHNKIVNLPASKTISLAVEVTGRGASLVGRASGGPVSPNTPYIVGEKGPELFVSNQAGTIIPNHRLRGGDGGSMGNVVLHFHGPVFGGEHLRSQMRQVARDEAHGVVDAFAGNVDRHQASRY